MSIRMRLILLYSIILALTLFIFGLALYTIQAQDTLNALKKDLGGSSERLTDAVLKSETDAAVSSAAPRDPPPPKPFDEFSSEQAFRGLREREIVRILDGSGALIASPFGNQEEALPLSGDGLAAAQNQQEWWEETVISDEHMLIYNRPIVQNGETVFIIQVARSLTERDRTLRSLAVTLGGAGLLTILVAVAAGWVLSGAALRPIHRITRTARAIGDERDFTQRVDYHGPQDEVGQLANTFNQMLARLQDAYHKVEHSLQMQRDFVADVSHELRTPLTTLRGNLGLLQRDPPAPQEEQADILVDLVHESDRLIRLVNNLLLLARADAGRSLARDRVEIQPVLEETVRQAHSLDTERKITIEMHPGAAVVCDRDAFKQVLLILIDNAMKHSRGEISLQVIHRDRQVEIRVRDYGEGIDPGHLEHIFDRFYRGENRTGEPGFGLGLPIARALMESMGGDIRVESKLGEGSAMVIHFPETTAE